MFFFNFVVNKHELGILHIRGVTNEKDEHGFEDGEDIYLIEKDPTTNKPNTICMRVVKQVGQVKVTEQGIEFNYTDEAFKKMIHYKEETGFSSLDGGWITNSVTGQSFMYQSAKNPIVPLDQMLSSINFIVFMDSRANHHFKEQQSTNKKSIFSRFKSSISMSMHSMFAKAHVVKRIKAKQIDIHEPSISRRNSNSC